MSLKKHKVSLAEYFRNNNWVRWGLLCLVTLTFILVVYPDFFVKRRPYELGDVVEEDIKAPKEFFIEHKEATEASRSKVLKSVRTVYDHDVTLMPQLRKRIDDGFGLIRAAIAETAEKRRKATGVDAWARSQAEIEMVPTTHDVIWNLKPALEEKLGISINDGAYHLLEKEGFSKKIPDLIDQILTLILTNGVVANKDVLLKERRGITLRNVATQSEKTVSQLKRIYGLDQAKTMVRVVGDPLLNDLNYSLRNLIVDFLQAMIQPNITLNRNETKNRKQKALAEIKPVVYKIKAGEMLLREGERVTEVQLLKLNALQDVTSKKKIIFSGMGASMIMFCLCIVAYMLHSNQSGRPTALSNKDLLCLATVLILLLIAIRISASLSQMFARSSSFPLIASSLALSVPLASGAMVICLFLGIKAGISFAVVIAVAAGIIFHNRLDLFVYFLLNGAMAAYWVQNCRERKVFIKTGLKLGMANVVVATALQGYQGELSGNQLLWDWLFAFLGGVGAGVVTAGIVPLFEITFDYITDIKLLELANMDQPILRRLMIEAPGTYHHSVIVGSLVEAAAAEIGANPVLAKVCGYYHDVGKLKKPLYFIENQTNGINKHNKLTPTMSKRILIAHIKDGVDIARQNRLGQTIIDTIIQHHGTSLISYFYEKALKMKDEKVVKMDDFRYAGPKPQTREAGLVMLADVVEAASRTLENPTTSRIQGLVQNLINKVFSDGQLDNCELTLKDLHKIANSFNKLLNGIHHHRIEYPDKQLVGNGKEKNGHPSGKSTKKIRSIPRQNSADSQSHLRRLGLP